jgi:carboxypeptidase Q
LSRFLGGLATVREGNNTRAAHTNPDTCNHALEEKMKLSAALAAYIIYELAVRDDKVPRKPVPAR